jgi:hypothetical protein
MARQLILGLSDTESQKESVRNFLSPLNLPRRQVEVLCTLAAHGAPEVRDGQSISVLAAPKASLRAYFEGGANTFLRGIKELESAGLAAIVRATAPWIYIVNWTRIAKLEPPHLDPLAGLEIFSPNFQTGPRPVQSGPGARDSVNAMHSKSVPSVSVFEPVAEGTCAGNRPWDRNGGVTDAELRGAVASQRLGVLRRLYAEAVNLGWIVPSEESMLRFLTIAHHAATSAGIHRRMAVVVSRVKQKCRVDGCRQASEQWAAAILAARHRDPSLAREEAGVQT